MWHIDLPRPFLRRQVQKTNQEDDLLVRPPLLRRKKKTAIRRILFKMRRFYKACTSQMGQPGKKGSEAQMTLSGVLLCGTDCAYFKHLNHQSMLKITSLVPRLT